MANLRKSFFLFCFRVLAYRGLFYFCLGRCSDDRWLRILMILDATKDDAQRQMLTKDMWVASPSDFGRLIVATMFTWSFHWNSWHWGKPAASNSTPRVRLQSSCLKGSGSLGRAGQRVSKGEGLSRKDGWVTCSNMLVNARKTLIFVDSIVSQWRVWRVPAVITWFGTGRRCIPL